MKSLIIVESPTKAKTIESFLGKRYKVIASKGHIRDLPKSTFGIKEEEDGTLTPKYSISRTSKNKKEETPADIVRKIKKYAKDADKIYIATDEDREGEAIGYHIAVAINLDPEIVPRIVFHEITKSAIQKALKNPRKLDLNSINAQQTRRMLDRIVGYKLSPLLSSKIQKGLSAGRVQSSTLKIIIDKEREINSFKKEEYWTIKAIFEKNIESSIYIFKDIKLNKVSINDEKEAKNIVSSIKKDSFIVNSIEKKKRVAKTNPPFITSTLQQVASTKFGFSLKKTMTIAQKLYEGVKTDKGVFGVITYMRTDSFNISQESIKEAREYIKIEFGKEYVPSNPKKYITKKKRAQEAHEAIRPTTINFAPIIANKFLSDDELKLYTLIYNRFIASQMNDAQLETQTILFSGKETVFKALGKKLVFDGFYKILGYEDSNTLIKNIKKNQKVNLDKLDDKQNWTEPPARYNPASIIKKIEDLEIGRPSTYAPTIANLETRKYIKIDKKRIFMTEIGTTVIEILEKHFSDIVDSNFTSNMEDNLDKIAYENIDWQKILQDFYKSFMEKIKEGQEKIISLKIATPTGKFCPDCKEELYLKKGRFGEFIACSGFPKCKYTANTDFKAKPKPEMTDKICIKCSKFMVIKDSKRGKFLACSGYPKCRNTKPLIPERILDIPCPYCGKALLEKNGVKSIFFGCEDYPDCRFISKTEPIDKKCPKCKTNMTYRELKTGNFHKCLSKKCKYVNKLS